MIVTEYAQDDIDNVLEHCRREVEARRVWAANLSPDFMESMSGEALAFANDVFCQPVDVQINHLLGYFHQHSHLKDSNGSHVYPHVMRQWHAAMNGEGVEGEFGYLQRLFPTDAPIQDFDVSPPGL
jgi:hypothetical protein